MEAELDFRLGGRDEELSFVDAQMIACLRVRWGCKLLEECGFRLELWL